MLERAFSFCIKISRNIDPACGCGNFLIITYQKLRELEHEILKLLYDNTQIGMVNVLYTKVGLHQFYGIEIEDFPCEIAKVSLLLMKHLMDQEISHYFGMNLIDFPIRDNANIIQGNALRMDWAEVVSKDELDYIIGNPPFLGARIMSAEQKQDVLHVFGNTKNIGNLDYVACWYRKAADLMHTKNIRAALVSTNSITQGDQVAILWKPLLKEGIKIDFAYRTFKWSNEAKGKAAVHCVIIGFSLGGMVTQKVIYENGLGIHALSINPYLVDAPDIVVESRQKSICDVPEIGIGNKPIDGGNYLFTEGEMKEFVQKEPQAAPNFHLWFGSDEFINRRPRYCLYLGELSPSELRKMPLSLARINAVRQLRLESTSAGTRKIAETPARFHVTNIPHGPYLLVQKVSSERRVYVPIGFMSQHEMASDLVFVIPDATMYHFGVLTSGAHMAWMRTVAGRLEMRYRYSKDIVYNNFIWPNCTVEQKVKIERAAQGILDARAKYPNDTYADLYDETVMPYDLRKAHQDNDRAVWDAYGRAWPINDEIACVAYLMKLYQEMTMKTN